MHFYSGPPMHLLSGVDTVLSVYPTFTGFGRFWGQDRALTDSGNGKSPSTRAEMIEPDG
jgi:hypothetical protein